MWHHPAPCCDQAWVCYHVLSKCCCWRGNLQILRQSIPRRREVRRSIVEPFGLGWAFHLERYIYTWHIPQSESWFIGYLLILDLCATDPKDRPLGPPGFVPDKVAHGLTEACEKETSTIYLCFPKPQPQGLIQPRWLTNIRWEYTCFNMVFRWEYTHDSLVLMKV